MVNIYDAPINELIDKAAQELKKVEAIKEPEWAPIVKTGPHKELPPTSADWWYVRTAAVLRSIYKLGPIGVSKLRTKYGGKKNRGYQPEKFMKSSGSIIRHILQQLDASDFTKQAEKSGHKGRIVTAKGKKFLDDVASTLVKETPTKVVKAEPKVEAKSEKKNEKTKVEEKSVKTPKEEVKSQEKKEETKVEEKSAETPKEEDKE